MMSECVSAKRKIYIPAARCFCVFSPTELWNLAEKMPENDKK